jgi:hypothetical protein
MNFKIGDRVERCNYPAGGLKVGETGVVVDMQNRYNIAVQRDDGGRSSGHHAANLKLVDVTPTITVEQALAFLKAKGEVTFKPKWEPAKVALNDTHVAVVNRDHVSVGCQKFSFESIILLYDVVQSVKKHGK